jgi:hypothetical protein
MYEYSWLVIQQNSDVILSEAKDLRLLFGCARRAEKDG